MKKLTILSLVLFITFGCNKSSSEMAKDLLSQSDNSTSSVSSGDLAYEEDFSIQPPRTASPSNPQSNSSIEKSKKIIKEGKIKIEVENLTFAKNYIDSTVKRTDAYYEKETLQNSGYTQKYNLKIRIPASNFNTLISALEEGEGLILEKNINAKDVSEEYLDLEIRLDNNRAYLKRYNELLSKAKSIKDMLEIQEKIRQIELLIDTNVGRIRFLSDRVDYSTLNVELIKKPEEYIAEAPPTFFDNIIDAFKGGFSGLLFFILIIANLWPIVFGIILIWMFRKKMFGFLFRKKALIE